MEYKLVEEGEKDTFDYCLYFYKDDEKISPWHDIKLFVEEETLICNMIIEIPKNTRKKMEINKETKNNPIKQDVKNGKLREISMDYPFNYGALPQTWESPNFKDKFVGYFGDNDPLDACDISELDEKYQAYVGEVKQVKIIGCYAMVDKKDDEYEADWKIICLDIRDPLAEKINNVKDLMDLIPERIEKCFNFLRDYKIPEGKGQNKFCFDNQLLDKDKALEIIKCANLQWIQYD